MSEYRATIGLEIHAELKTSTKMFCRSLNNPDELRPNVNVCPVCLAHPGTLPVINEEAILHVLRVGVALGATLADYTEFDRKNYFYPDLPKGYQISQYEYPLVSGGSLAGVQITRIHLEEDTASSMHDETNGETTIDFNRAGIPLMELVTDPVIHNAEDAAKFARELQLLFRYLEASDADMEKGQMRVEANISVSSGKELGTKVEIKNLNSFRAMERAVAYEIRRQSEALDRGERIVQETRGWDEVKQATFRQRTKEGSADYRYFPDPDLPSLRLSEISAYHVDRVREGLPELPTARRARYTTLGLKSDDVELFVTNGSLGSFFDEVVVESGNNLPRIQLAANYIANDLVKIIRDMERRDTEIDAEIPILSHNLGAIIDLLLSGKVSSRGGKNILRRAVETGLNVEDIAKDEGFLQVSNSTDLDLIASKIIADNPSVVEDYMQGKDSAIQFLIGEGMKASKGSGNPKVLKDIYFSKLKRGESTEV